MLERLTRFSRSVAHPFTAILLTALGAAGCEGDDPGESTLADESIKNVNVNADTLAKLGATGRLSIDMSATGVMYHFSVATPLDFSRIDLSFPAGKASMDSALKAALRQMQGRAKGEAA